MKYWSGIIKKNSLFILRLVFWQILQQEGIIYYFYGSAFIVPSKVIP